jgi:hypothetical protein
VSRERSLDAKKVSSGDDRSSLSVGATLARAGIANELVRVAREFSRARKIHARARDVGSTGIEDEKIHGEDAAERRREDARVVRAALDV